MLSDEMSNLFDDPLGYVMFAFPWDSDASIQVVPLAAGVDSWMTEEDKKYREEVRARFPHCEFGPDLWACQFLDELGREIKARGFNPNHPTPVMPIRFSTVSGHEIGKTCVVAWLIKFILDTRPMSKGSVTAVTDEQLRTKTWAELGKWHHLSLTEHWFRYSSGRGSMSISHSNPAYSGSWRCDARTSRKEKTESFAGQHAPTGTSFYIFDEASGLDKSLFEVREGGTSSGEPMIFDFGNGTRNSGGFFENCKGRESSRYVTRSIDSRSVYITNKETIRENQEIWGEDSDRFKVRWRGLFPDSSTVQFLPSDEVEAAMARMPVEDPLAPIVIGVDVARFGNDSTVLYARKGSDARSFEPRVFSKLPVNVTIEKTTAFYNYFAGLGQRPAMIFVDETGVGGGVVDGLAALGYPVTGVNFGSVPQDAKKYRFRGDEMWGRLSEALPRLSLPSRDTEDGERLFEDLTQREYSFTIAGEKINLESKTEMKKRGLRSPDIADALVLTFANEVLALLPDDPGPAGDSEGDFDPHAYLEA
jgi:hypothetical protein